MNIPTPASEGGQAQDPPQPQAAPVPVTAESLAEMANSDDPEAVRRAIDLMQKIDEGASLEQLNQELGVVAPAPEGDTTPEPAPSAAPAAVPTPEPQAPLPVDDPNYKPPVDAATPAQPPAGPAPQAAPQKYYQFKYQGSESQLNDSDGYLGYGSIEGMKKALAHRTMFLSDVEQDRDTIRSRANEEIAKRERIEREAEELRTRIAQSTAPAPATPATPVVPSAPPVPGAVVVPPAQTEIEIPQAPVAPDIPADPSEWTDEHAAADRKWRQDMSNYTAKMQLAVQAIVTRPVAPIGPSPELAQTIAEMREQIAAANEQLVTVKQERQNIEQMKQEQAYWNGMQNFISKHKEYELPAEPQKVDTEVKTWMDRVAYANGLRLPFNPTKDDVVKYNNKKLMVVGSYLDNDPQVVERCQGFNPPDGYETYFRLGDLYQARSDYISSGRLGQNSTLEDAWLYKQHVDGGLDTSVANLELTAQERGATNTLEALSQHAANDAVTIPGDAAQRVPNQEGWTQQEIVEALSATADELARNPQLREKKAKIMASLPVEQRTT